MQKRRMAQINQLLREQIGEILIREEKDAFERSLTVTEVRTSGDMSQARVYVMTHRNVGDSDEMQQEGSLEKVAERVQRELGPRIHLKRTPKLIFQLDETAEQAAKIEALLERVKDDLNDD